MNNWICKAFSEHSADELYKILQLRSMVFVVEQNCPYLDCDNNDQQALHFGLWQNDNIIAYVRLLSPGLMYKEPSIGRVCTAPSIRNTGIGRQLMKKAIEEIYRLYGEVPIRIGAQLYLKKFYGSFGFIEEGNIYLEDNIEHIIMVKP